MMKHIQTVTTSIGTGSSGAAISSEGFLDSATFRYVDWHSVDWHSVDWHSVEHHRSPNYHTPNYLRSSMTLTFGRFAGLITFVLGGLLVLCLSPESAIAQVYQCNGVFQNTACKQGEQGQQLTNLPELSRYSSPDNNRAANSTGQDATGGQEVTGGPRAALGWDNKNDAAANKITEPLEPAEPIEQQEDRTPLNEPRLDALALRASSLRRNLDSIMRSQGVDIANRAFIDLKVAANLRCTGKPVDENLGRDRRCDRLMEDIKNIAKRVQEEIAQHR